MLTNVLLALVLSAAIALATGPKLIEWLRGHQMKTSENELGPKEHLKKRGTPIMGGLMIALGCIVSFVLCAAYTGAWVTTILPLLLVSLGSMAVGLADDWTKAVKHRSEGLTPWQKIIGLSVVCLGFSVWCYFTQGSKVLLPFANTEWDLGLWYIPLLALTVLFMTNSANLQDGIDGILSSVTSVGCMGWAVIAGLSAVTVYQHLNGGSFGIPMVKFPMTPMRRALCRIITARLPFSRRHCAAAASASCATTAIRQRCSWATPGRCSSAARWSAWRCCCVSRSCCC